MDAFFSSQLGHYPLVWMFHNRYLNNRINKLQGALRLVYKDTTSSFNELLEKENTFPIHRKLPIEMFKVNHKTARKLICELF